MKFLYYVSWLPLALIDFLVALTAYPLAPIAVLFARDEHLPRWAWYLETHDEPLYGDSGHIERWFEFAQRHGDFGAYCQRVAWLWRNKAYNYSYWIAGRPMEGPFRMWGNPKVESGNPVNIPGYLFVTTDKAWCLFAFIPYLRIGKRQFYIRIYFGWKMKKLANYPDIHERAMLGNHFSPFRNIVIE